MYKIMYKNVLLDNRGVVPYNPYYCSKYNVYINVEICNTIKAVKYFYKYISRLASFSSIA